MTESNEFHGQQLRAARALADMTIAELAASAGVTPRTIHRLEIGGSISLAPSRRHGHVSSEVWEKIVEALIRRGVQLTPATREHGAGVRWRESSNR